MTMDLALFFGGDFETTFRSASVWRFESTQAEFKGFVVTLEGFGFPDGGILRRAERSPAS